MSFHKPSQWVRPELPEFFGAGQRFVSRSAWHFRSISVNAAKHMATGVGALDTCQPQPESSAGEKLCAPDRPLNHDHLRDRTGFLSHRVFMAHAKADVARPM